MNELKSHESPFSSVLRDVRFVFAALGAGSRIVPLADNREVIADLAASAASIYGNAASARQVNGRPTRPD
jgi:hypothetical protein